MRLRPGRRFLSTISASDLPVGWKVFRVGKERRVRILPRQRRSIPPVDADRGIVPADRDLVLGTIEIVAFVEKVRGL